MSKMSSAILDTAYKHFESERDKAVRAKRAAGKAGKYKRSSKSNVTGTASRNLKHWVKQDWRQVGNPSKKCGEK